MRIGIKLDNPRESAWLFSAHKRSEGVTYCGVGAFDPIFKFEGESEAIGRFLGSLERGRFRVLYLDKTARRQRRRSP